MTDRIIYCRHCDMKFPVRRRPSWIAPKYIEPTHCRHLRNGEDCLRPFWSYFTRKPKRMAAVGIDPERLEEWDAENIG